MSYNCNNGVLVTIVYPLELQGLNFVEKAIDRIKKLGSCSFERAVDELGLSYTKIMEYMVGEKLVHHSVADSRHCIILRNIEASENVCRRGHNIDITFELDPIVFRQNVTKIVIYAERFKDIFEKEVCTMAEFSKGVMFEIIKIPHIDDSQIEPLQELRTNYVAATFKRVMADLGVNYPRIMNALYEHGCFVQPTTADVLIVDTSTIEWTAYPITNTIDVYFKVENVERFNKNVKRIVVDASMEPFRFKTYKKNEEENKMRVYKCYGTKPVPAVTKVEFFNQGKPTIKVTFADNTHTTATCSDNDVFDFDTGLGVCIAKRALGSDFNRLIEKAHKLYDHAEDEKLKKAKEDEKEACREIKKAVKKANKRARKEAEWRQEQIDILAAAIKKARESGVTFEHPEIGKVPHKEVFKIAAHMIKQAHNREERNKKILELRSQGKTYNQIAEELHVSKSTVGEVVREANKH